MILEFVLQYNPSTLSNRVTVTAKVKVDTFKGKLKPKLEFQRGGLKQKMPFGGRVWLFAGTTKWEKDLNKGQKKVNLVNFTFFLSFY